MELDHFAWITNNCEPIAAQEAELVNCSFARESEDFEEFSPSPTPINAIGMFSLPATPNSADQLMEGEDAVFHTPPEHHADSPLEDQNPNHLSAEKVTISEAKRARVVAGEEFDGDTVPSGETEVVESEGDGAVGRIRVVSDEDLEIAAWLDEWCAANKAAAAAIKREIGGFMNNGVDIENVEGIGIGGEKPNEASDLSGSFASCEIVECKSCEIESGGFEKDVEISKSAEKTAKGGRNGGLRRIIEKIDGGKCKLSPSSKGKEKDAGDSCEIVGYRSCETESCELEKGVEMAKSPEKSAKDGHGNDGKRIKKIDGRKQKLSPLSKGKEKNTWGSSEVVGYKSCETESGGLEKGVESAKSAEKSAKDGNGNGGVNNKGRRTQKIDARKQKLSPSCKKKKKVTWGSCKICEAEAGVLEKGVEMAKSAERNAKDGHGNRGVDNNKGIRIEKTDGRKRKLPPSCTGKEKDAGENSKKQKNAAKDGHGNGGVNNNKGIRIEKTDGRKRKLPPSCTGKEKDAGENSEKQSGSPPLLNEKEKGKDEGGSSKKKNGLSEFSEFLDFLMKHFNYERNDDEDDGDDDFIATAKKRGMNFVTPRIWKRL